MKSFENEVCELGLSFGLELCASIATKWNKFRIECEAPEPLLELLALLLMRHLFKF